MVHENHFSCKRCFVTIPSATPVVKACNSASAELKLTVCCVLDHAVSVAFPHAVSFTLFMTSAHVQFSHKCYLSPSSSTSDSVVGVLFKVGVITVFASSKPRTFITFRMYFGFASTEHPRAVRSITLPRKQILSPVFSILPVILNKTCFDKSSTSFRTSFFGPNIDPSVRLRKQLGSVRSGQDILLVPQFWSFAMSEQCFVQFPHFVFFQSCIMPLICANKYRHPRAGMLCARQSKL